MKNYLKHTYIYIKSDRNLIKSQISLIFFQPVCRKKVEKSLQVSKMVSLLAQFKNRHLHVEKYSTCCHFCPDILVAVAQR